VKKAGIIGGIAPESTIDYYRSMVALYQARTADGSYPPIIIESIDLQKLLSFVSAGRLEELTDYISAALVSLAAGGAEFAAMASNTPHVAFDRIAGRSPVPLISIVDAAVAAAQSRKLGRCALFGTRFTMQGRFYADAFNAAGIDLISPNAAEQAAIHEIYMNELVKGVFKDESRAALLQILDAMKTREHIQALVLAGTELPLILRGHEPAGVSFVDTAQLHVERIVDMMLS
jgi:aspartate racemase